MRVLSIVHGFPPSGAGGSELYAEAHARALVRLFGDEVFVLTREQAAHEPEYRVRYETRDGVRIRWINNTFRHASSFEETYDNPAVRALAASVIDEIRPEVAHVHHLTCLSTTILDELDDRGIPIVLTLHDYWLLCHRGQLLDAEMQRCDGPGEHGCAKCTGVPAGAPGLVFLGARALREVGRYAPAFADRLRSSARHFATSWGSRDGARETSRLRMACIRHRWRKVDVALAPSVHVRDRFIAAGFPASSIRVSEYGVDPAPFVRCRRGVASWPHDRSGQSTAAQGRAPLRLGFMGSLMVSKGAHVLLAALQRLPASRVTLQLFGQPTAYHGDDSYRRVVEPLLRHPRVRLHPPVAHDKVPDVLREIDVLVFPSIWEETSGIIAREATVAGVPVVASRIGGIPETIRDGLNGLLFEPGSPVDLARVLGRLLDEPDLLPRLRAHSVGIRTLDADVRATRTLYQELNARRTSEPASLGTRQPGNLRSSEPPNLRTSEPPNVRTSAPRIAAVVLNYRTPDQTRVAAEMLRRADPPLDHVIVVDNDEAAMAPDAPEIPDVVRMVTGRNLGFSGGCNVGIREALARGADAVFLVNSDVIVPPDCVRRLSDALDRQRMSGIVAPVIRSRPWPGVISSAGIDYAPGTGRMRHRQGHAAAAIAAVPWTSVDAVSGCAMLVRREVFERVGFLPEEYFFSFEDIAFCLQARAMGFDVGVAGHAAAYHEGSGTMGPSPRRLYFGARNHLLLAASTPSRNSVERLARLLLVTWYSVAHALRSREGHLGERIAAVLRGVADHARGRYGSGDRG